jgi:hypothetical protein
MALFLKVYFWLITFKNDVKVLLKSNMQKKFKFFKFFVGSVKVNDENRKIRIRIW